LPAHYFSFHQENYSIPQANENLFTSISITPTTLETDF
jgi:hypothetical protein